MASRPTGPSSFTSPASAGTSSQPSNQEYEGEEEQSSSFAALGFLKSLRLDSKHNKDGQLAKKRGPKPNNKPALTRRQELNRQAQRTHRERKELYIKTLEQEVLRIKEAYTETIRSRDALAAENQQLKQLLAEHGIEYNVSNSIEPFTTDIPSSFAPPTVGSSTLDTDVFSSPEYDAATRTTQSAATTATASQPDLYQVGVDFVLSLERPCMEHLHFLTARSLVNRATSRPVTASSTTQAQPPANPTTLSQSNAPAPSTNATLPQIEYISGHVHMLSCPPLTYFTADESEPSFVNQPPLPKQEGSSLAKLLELSTTLPIDRQGELTPVMALNMIANHERAGELSVEDLKMVEQELTEKVVCYGFGAVIEEYEVRDVLDSLFAAKDGSTTMT